MSPEDYMAQALNEARLAADRGEIPVGCVIVKDGQIIGRGHNRRETAASALAHAEIEAIAQANKALGSWRLSGCDLYVTLEPCPMCAGAIINARIDRIFYGAKEENTGCCGSVINLFYEPLGHRPAIYGAVLEEQCRELMTGFFARLREQGSL